MAGGDVLEMINIDKRFGGIHALRGFNFSCAAGEVHIHVLPILSRPTFLDSVFRIDSRGTASTGPRFRADGLHGIPRQEQEDS